MKSSLLLSAAAVALAAVALVLSSRPARTPAPGGAARAHDLDAARLDALEEAVEDLRARVEAVEAGRLAPVAAAPAPRVEVTAGGVTPEELAAALEELEERLAAPRGKSATGELAGLSEEALDQALAAAEKRRSVRKVQAQLEDRDAALDEEVAGFQAKLGLTLSQSTALRDALEFRNTRDAELVRQWREGVDPEELGRQKATNRGELTRRLSGFLNEDQVRAVFGGGK